MTEQKPPNPDHSGLDTPKCYLTRLSTGDRQLRTSGNLYPGYLLKRVSGRNYLVNGQGQLIEAGLNE